MDKTRRSWTQREEEVLIQSLKEIIKSGWKSENGFRIGYLQVLEQMMLKSFPQSDIKGLPHINSKIHVWKKSYGSLYMMLSKSRIGWNTSTYMIEATDEQWEAFLKTDPKAKVMCFKSWPYYDDWCAIFGNDRATGEQVEGVVDAVTELVKERNAIERKEEAAKKVQTNEIHNDKNQDSKCIPVCQGDEHSPTVKTGKMKRKLDERDRDEIIIEMLGGFFNDNKALMSDIASKIGYDYVVAKKQQEIYASIKYFEGSTMDEKLTASKLLGKDPEDLEVFSNLPEEERRAYVQLKLAGKV